MNGNVDQTSILKIIITYNRTVENKRTYAVTKIRRAPYESRLDRGSY